MAVNKVANGAKPNPPKKRKRKTVPTANPTANPTAKQKKRKPVPKKETKLASGATPKPPKKRTRRG